MAPPLCLCSPKTRLSLPTVTPSAAEGSIKTGARSDSLIRRLKNLQLDGYINSTYNAPKLMFYAYKLIAVNQKPK